MVPAPPLGRDMKGLESQDLNLEEALEIHDTLLFIDETIKAQRIKEFGLCHTVNWGWWENICEVVEAC